MRPMLVASGDLPADSGRWSYEVKWDGFRALIEAAPSGIKIWSRNGHDMTSRYPELQGLAGARSLETIEAAEWTTLMLQDPAGNEFCLIGPD